MDWDNLSKQLPSFERRSLAADTQTEADDIIEFAGLHENEDPISRGLDPDLYRTEWTKRPFSRAVSQLALGRMIEVAASPEHPMSRIAQNYLGELGV